MSTIVIMPGGFHPFHAGHYALYQSALKAFPGAEVYVAATNDQSERPFPFALKEKLAKLAGVAPGHFVQVKSPFQAKEITQNYNPEEDVLIFVRSEKDKNESPKPGGTKKDGSPAYFQPWTGKDVQPFAKHAYFAYLPTVEFGPGITSATQIRKAWPTLNDKRKLALVMSLYPAAQKNPKLAQNVVGMFDQVMGGQIDEGWKEKVGAAALAGAVATGAGANTPKVPLDQAIRNATAWYNINKAVKKQKEKSKEETPKKTDKEVNEQGVAEGSTGVGVRSWANQVRKDHGANVKFWNRKEGGGAVDSVIAKNSNGEVVGVYNRKTGYPTVFEPKQNSVEDTLNEFAPGNGDDGLPYAEYVVYQCDPKDQFEFIGGPLYQTDSLGMAHKYAYEHYLRYRPKAFVVYQPHKEASRGNYGVKGESDEDINEGKIKDIEDLLARHAQYYLDKEQNEGPLSGQDIHSHETVRKQLLAKKKRLQAEKDRTNEDERTEIHPDSELNRLYQFAQQHYPNMRNKQDAFVKYVTHALKHSEEDDARQDNQIDILDKEVDQIQKKLNVTENTDYLEEK